MFVDLSVKISPQIGQLAGAIENKALAGHLGTHFDVMDQEFPLEFAERRAIVFDVSQAGADEISLKYFDVGLIEKDMFVTFYSGFIDREGYGGKKYFSDHPFLSRPLLEELVKRKVSLVGIDFAGVRRGAEHTPEDQRLADNGIFVIENLCNLASILCGRSFARFTANTYPLNYIGMTGIPCRVLAKI